MELLEINSWSKRLGLLPVPLREGHDFGSKYILLNGSDGNFCLDLTYDRTNEAARSIAWSSNVGHYVGIIESYVEVYRWDQRLGAVERYSAERVREKLDDFHRYLEKTKPDSSLSVVTHGMRVFRSLRTALGHEINGSNALKAFLFFLACSQKGIRRGELKISDWGLDEVSLGVALTVMNSEWDALVSEFVRGRPLESLKLDIGLLLRHASGVMFQEAHYEALTFDDSQMRLGLYAPEPVRLSKQSRGIGLHFTPPSLARTLVESSIAEIDLQKSNRLVIFDPACGSGEFLRETLRQLQILDYTGEIQILGWDISEAACAMAKFALTWDLNTSLGSLKRTTVDIQCVDSLRGSSNWPREVDLILMNPPFVSWEGMTHEQKETVSNLLGAKMLKRPDLSSAFLWMAAQNLKRGGILGCILPASFLNSDSASRLRHEIGERLSTRLIARLGSHALFPNALIDTGLLIGKSGVAATTPTVAFWADYHEHSASAGLRSLRRLRHEANRLDLPIVSKSYSIYYNDSIGKGERSWAPRPYEAWRFLRALPDQTRVKDLFSVHQGARTGHNRVLLLSAEEWGALPSRERDYFRPAVVNDSLHDGVLAKQAYVFFPYGKNMIANETELKKQVKVYYKQQLLPNKQALMGRARIKQNNWWGLMEHRAWQREPSTKIVTSYFGDIGSFAWDDDGSYVVVQGHAWLPKQYLSGRKLSKKLVFAYLAILNSRLFSRLLSASSNHVGGGQWDLSPRFINEIPLPDLTSDSFDPAVLEELSALGRSIHKGELRFILEHKDHDDLVAVAYGVKGLGSFQ